MKGKRLLSETSEAVTVPWSFSGVLSQAERGQFDTFDDLAFNERHLRQKPEEASFAPRTPRVARSRSMARSVPPPDVHVQSD